MTTKELLDPLAWTDVVDVVDHVRRRAASISAEELTEIAGSVFERHARMLLADLLATPNLLDPAKDSAIRRRFAEGLDRAGTALREALAESRHRHAVSQVLQRKMFEVEVIFRRALKARIVELRTGARPDDRRSEAFFDSSSATPTTT